ncbi:MAG: hypothetical protein WC637_03475 [Victivallales bacterium]
MALEMSVTGYAFEAKLNERGDAGPSVADKLQPVKLVLSQNGSADKAILSETLAVRTSIHVLGGGVRGFGVLASFAEPGPGKIQIRRATSFSKGEPYTPIALARVVNPDGKTVSAIEMTEQKEPESVYSVDVPKGNAGIWRISISGGRQFDRYEIRLAGSKSWGVRGEMSLSVNDSIPNPAYLYLPSSVKQIAIERIGGAEDAMEVFDESGKSLGFPSKNAKSGERRVLQLDDPPSNSVLKIVFKNTENMVILIDGVPGLLCPSPEIARDLKGGIIVSGGMNTAGPLQARARNWMLSCSEKDLEVKAAALSSWSPDKIANPMSEAQLCGCIVKLPEALKNQNLDKSDPFYGSPSKKNPDQMSWEAFHYCLLGPWDTAFFAVPAAIESPINPYFKNKALVRRVTLSAFSKISSLQGDELFREGFLGMEKSAPYPITHAFFAYGALAENFEMMKDLLEPVTREIWRDVVVAVGDKLADNQGYQSNQWTHNLAGHLASFRSTGEQRFLGYFERQLNAYLDCAWGPNSKFGQHPAGFYLEEFGADGNYDNMNLASVVKFYYLYKELKEARPELVGKLEKSIKANLNFKSFFWTEFGGICPTALNSRRQESSLMASNPAGDYLAHRQFDMALSRTKLSPMPPKGTYPASVFSYYAVTDEWARRLLAEFADGKGSSYPAGAIFHKVYADVPLVSKEAVIPFKAKEGAWELPGLFANKSKGFYVLDFYDVAGADKNRKLLGMMGGGPTMISSGDLGPFIMSMSPLTAQNAVNSEDDLTFSCVFAKGADGKIVFSGKERAAGKWLEKGKAWEVRSDFMGGELTWRYEFSDDSVSLKISLKGGTVPAAFINLPVLMRKGIDLEESSGGIILKKSGARPVEIKFPESAILSKAAPCNPKGYSVRRLQVPLAPDGAIKEILITTGRE